MSAIAPLRFSKMHGAGNDFVIIDQRGAARRVDAALAARIADRHTGIGCDQLITIEAPSSAAAIARYGIWNTDGSAALQCGNGARCVAAWLQRDGSVRDAGRFVLDSPSGPVDAELLADDRVAIGMGVPQFAPERVPLRDALTDDPLMLDFARERIYFGAVSMGNPHVVLEVADVATADVERVGQMLQQHPQFPQSCNVGFAQILSPSQIRLRVFERGVGETLACGSGACAAVAVLARRARLGSRVAVQLPGGTLDIHWPGVGQPISMTGPTAFVFEGEFGA
jgi:diaminopimelate epimerase